MVKSQETDVRICIRGAAMGCGNPSGLPRARVCRTIWAVTADISDSGGSVRTHGANGTALAPFPVYDRHLINEGANINDPRSHA